MKDKYDYDLALDEIKRMKPYEVSPSDEDDDSPVIHMVFAIDVTPEVVATFKRALLIAKRLEEEPSEGMIAAAENNGADSYYDDFISMRDQLYKEIDTK